MPPVRGVDLGSALSSTPTPGRVEGLWVDGCRVGSGRGWNDHAGRTHVAPVRVVNP